MFRVNEDICEDWFELIEFLIKLTTKDHEPIVLDPFMGSGSTIAAASALGLTSIGIERDDGYFRLAAEAIPRLAALKVK